MKTFVHVRGLATPVLLGVVTMRKVVREMGRVGVVGLFGFAAVAGALGTASLGCKGRNVGGAAQDAAVQPDVEVLVDAEVHEDAGEDGGLQPVADCRPQAVANNSCVPCSAFAFLGAFWDGVECFELMGCACTGEGCDRGFASLEECQETQASCDSALCLATGGEWRADAPCGPCGHYWCGMPPVDACCDAGCDCGPSRNFVEGMGCQLDPACTPEQACLATDGTWFPASDCYCGFHCGLPDICGACLDSCDCGPYRNFDETEGCQVDAACGTDTNEELCLGTGGQWGTAPCGPFVCGEGAQPWGDPCLLPDCYCGPLFNFVDGIGCVYDQDCVVASDGDPCQGRVCRAGLVCCSICGMDPGCPTCITPCCDNGDPFCSPGGCPTGIP